jgi:hypothetical protein
LETVFERTMTASDNQRETEPAPFRFGVLCADTSLLEWEIRCIERLLELPGAELALVIINPADPAGRRPAAADGPQPLFWRIFARFLSRPRSLRPRMLSERFPEAPRLSGDSVGEAGLDFLLRFGGAAVRDGQPAAARYGVWSFALGGRGRPLGFWEMHRGEATAEAGLHLLAGEPARRAVLRQGRFCIFPYSYKKSIDQLLFEAARWPAQAYAGLRRGAALRFRDGPAPPARPAGRPPTNGETARLLWRAARAYAGNLFHTFFRDAVWGVGVVRKPIHAFLEPGFRPAVEWLPPRPRRFAADPFGVVRGGKTYLFFEDFSFRDYKGRIACSVWGGAGAARTAPVLDSPGHLSYPYLFEHRGDVYCIPEASQAREVALYKAAEFPSRWVRVAALLEGVAAADPTVFSYQERWWLTGTLENDHGDPNVDLYVWHAPDLLGPWAPHAANPVKTDVRSARPAGAPFLHEGALYRPAQDCSRTYGGRVVLQRVVRLTPTEFHEEPAAAVEPSPTGPYPDGLHTLNALGEFTLVDGKRFRFDPDACRHALARTFARVARRWFSPRKEAPGARGGAA